MLRRKKEGRLMQKVIRVRRTYNPAERLLLNNKLEEVVMFAYRIGRQRLRTWVESFYVSEKKLGIKDLILYALNMPMLFDLNVILRDCKEIKFEKNEELSVSVDQEGYIFDLKPEDTFDLKIDDRTVFHARFGDIYDERLSEPNATKDLSCRIFLKHPDENLWRKAWEYYIKDEGKITEKEINTIKKFKFLISDFSIRDKLNVTLPNIF